MNAGEDNETLVPAGDWCSGDGGLCKLAVGVVGVPWVADLGGELNVMTTGTADACCRRKAKPIPSLTALAPDRWVLNDGMGWGERSLLNDGRGGW